MNNSNFIRLLIVKFSLLAVFAAVTLTSSAKAEQGFTPFSQVTDPVKMQLGSSVFLLRSAIKMQGCTGIKIGETNALTAFHCFRDCLIQGNWFDEQTKETSPQGEQITVYRRTERASSPVSCSVYMQFQGTFETADVVGGPPCMALVKAVDSDAEGISLNYPGCDRAVDIIELKYRNSRALDRLTSAPLATRQPARGESVFALGFPGETRRGSKDSKGTEMMLSQGEIVRTDVCKHTDLDGVEHDIPLPVKPSMRVLQTTVDVIGRSSGSPLFNSRGEVVGLASGIFHQKQNNRSYCAGATFFSNVQALRVTPFVDVRSSWFRRVGF